jgi:hypothetical protein
MTDAPLYLLLLATALFTGGCIYVVVKKCG